MMFAGSRHAPQIASHGPMTARDRFGAALRGASARTENTCR